MRKIMNWTIMIYVMYGIIMYWYLFHASIKGIPEGFIGTSADPSVFMNARELQLSTEYSRMKDLLFFLATPLEWIVVIFFLLSKNIEIWVKKRITSRWLQITVFYLLFSAFVYLCTFPFQLCSYLISKTYHVSVQSFTSWLNDELLDFVINFIIMVFIVQVFMYLIRRWKNRWWVIGWLLTIPFTLFLTFIQPVVLDPLYNNFTPISNKELESKILTMADEAGVPISQVFEVKMSGETNALNAYVNGIGSNARIVLWDTTLERLTDEEILFIMAHEISHYVHHHIYWGIAFGLSLSFIGFYLVHLILRKVKINSERLTIIPIVLLTVSILTFVSSPVTNIFSRYEERVSDEYAVWLTDDKEAGIKTFQSLSKASLSEVNPPLLVKWFLYSHPTIFERIVRLQD